MVCVGHRHALTSHPITRPAGSAAREARAPPSRHKRSGPSANVRLIDMPPGSPACGNHGIGPTAACAAARRASQPPYDSCLLAAGGHTNADRDGRIAVKPAALDLADHPRAGRGRQGRYQYACSGRGPIRLVKIGANRLVNSLSSVRPVSGTASTGTEQPLHYLDAGWAVGE